jgi:hypothetical protein
MYEKRFYRDLVKLEDLVTFEVAIKETDLFIATDAYSGESEKVGKWESGKEREGELKEKASNAILKYRNQIEDYIRENPLFQSSLRPLPVDRNAPEIVRIMQETSLKAGVGPFASVAGAVAEFVGRELLKYSKEVIVENGGDIFLKTLKKRRIGIFAGKSKLSNRLALEISPDETPLGVCTSSGTVGHSLSFGKADAVVVVSKSCSLADASATAIGNLIKKKEDIPQGIERAKRIEGLKGVIIIKNDKLGVWGNLKLTKVGK